MSHSINHHEPVSFQDFTLQYEPTWILRYTWFPGRPISITHKLLSCLTLSNQGYTKDLGKKFFFCIILLQMDFDIIFLGPPLVLCYRLLDSIYPVVHLFSLLHVSYNPITRRPMSPLSPHISHRPQTRKTLFCTIKKQKWKRNRTFTAQLCEPDVDHL